MNVWYVRQAPWPMETVETLFRQGLGLSFEEKLLIFFVPCHEPDLKDFRVEVEVTEEQKRCLYSMLAGKGIRVESSEKARAASALPLMVYPAREEDAIRV